MNSVRETFVAAVLLLVLFGIVAKCAGCSPAAKPTPAQVAAEASYGAALLACVEQATTLAESKACRAKVDAAWNVVQTGKDAGK
jgi:hypothetical protein